MRIRFESPNQPDVLLLIDELDRYQKPLYPAGSHHGAGLPALMLPDVLFAVARTDEGKAVGCGAIVLGLEYGEIKRMFVSPSVRGRGVGKQLLAFLDEGLHALRSRDRLSTDGGDLAVSSKWICPL